MDAEIARREIEVKEAQGRLDASQAHRDRIAQGCTHKDSQGKSTADPGVFGWVCMLCGGKDF